MPKTSPPLSLYPRLRLRSSTPSGSDPRYCKACVIPATPAPLDDDDDADDERTLANAGPTMVVVQVWRLPHAPRAPWHSLLHTIRGYPPCPLRLTHFPPLLHCEDPTTPTCSHDHPPSQSSPFLKLSPAYQHSPSVHSSRSTPSHPRQSMTRVEVAPLQQSVSTILLLGGGLQPLPERQQVSSDLLGARD